MLVLSLLLSLLSYLRRAEATTCYWGTNQPFNSTSYVPCGSQSGNSDTPEFFSCCHLGDYCLEEGACFSARPQLTYVTGCTDPTYADTTCGAQSCDGTSTGTGNLIQGIAKACDNTDWICCSGQRQQNADPDTAPLDSCPCDRHVGVAITGKATLVPTASLPADFNGQILLLTTGSAGAAVTYSTEALQQVESATQQSSASTSQPSVSSSASSITTSTQPQAPAPTSTSSTPPPAPDQSSIRLGVGIGVPLGVIAIGTILGITICLLFRRRRRSRKANKHPLHSQQPGDFSPYYENTGRNEIEHVERNELEGTGMKFELGGNRIWELGSEGRGRKT